MNTFLNYLRQNWITALVIAISLVCLLFALKGYPGNPTETDLNNPNWREHGVFELSPERGRFALTYSIVEQKSVQFTEQIARFAVPDVATYEGTYVSLFAPGLSYVVAPGYILGKVFGISQVGTFSIVAIFGLINMILVFKISKKIGAHPVAALLGGFTFLFATPAFVYSVNLYQHHVSTFLILLSIYLLTSYRSIWVNIVVFMLCGASISIDYPNFFFMMPVGIVAFSRLINFKTTPKNIKVQIPVLKLLTIIAVAIPLLFLFWFQSESYGNPLRLSGSLPTAKFDLNKVNIDDLASIPEDILNKRKDAESTDKNVVGFFESRILLNSFYLHFISPDRGMLTFTPVILLGFVGLIFAYRRKMQYLLLISSVLFIVIILYSLWGDPWGGWAFGSRYLVPAYAMLGILIAMFLTYFRKNIFVSLLFGALLCFSLFVNTAGAITTIANPPKVEVLALEELSGEIQRYSYDRATHFLDNNESKAFLYNAGLKQYMNAWQYYYVIYIPLVLIGLSLLGILQFTKKENNS